MGKYTRIVALAVVFTLLSIGIVMPSQSQNAQAWDDRMSISMAGGFTAGGAIIIPITYSMVITAASVATVAGAGLTGASATSAVLSQVGSKVFFMGSVADGWGIVAGLVIACVVTVAIFAFLSAVANVEPEQYQRDRERMGEQLANSTFNLVAMVEAQTLNTKELWETSTDYFIKKAEWGAYELWMEQRDDGTLDDGYDAIKVFQKADTMKDGTGWNFMNFAQANEVLKLNDNLASAFTGDVLEHMEWGVGSDVTGGWITNGATNSVNAERGVRAYGMTCEIGGGTSTETGYVVWANTSKTWAVCTDAITVPTSASIVVKDIDGNTVRTFTETVDSFGKYIAFNLTGSGLPLAPYNIIVNSNANFRIMGYGVAWDSDNTIVPAIISFVGNDSSEPPNEVVDVIYVNSAGFDGTNYGTYVIRADGEAYVATPTEFPCIYYHPHTDDIPELTAVGGQAKEPDDAQFERFTADLGGWIQAMHDAMSDMHNTFYIADLMAHAMYNAVADSNGTIVVPPSSLGFDWTMIRNVEGLTWQQLYAIYVAYMLGIRSFFSESSGNYTFNLANISAESFNVLCRGTIYDAHGNQISDSDVIFSPFATLRQVTIYSGNETDDGWEARNNTWNQIGFAIIWASNCSIAEYRARGATDSTSFINRSTNPILPKYKTIGNGYTLRITEMWYNNRNVDSITFNVTSLDFTIKHLKGYTVYPPEPVRMPTLWEQLAEFWWVFMVLIGFFMTITAVLMDRKKHGASYKFFMGFGVSMLIVGVLGGALWYMGWKFALMWYHIVMLIGLMVIIWGLATERESGRAKLFVFLGALIFIAGMVAWILVEIANAISGLFDWW